MSDRVVPTEPRLTKPPATNQLAVDGVAQAPLIATKLHAPPPVAGYCDRPRIRERLDAGLDETVRLTLVSAPPGYGKSVAVAGWLNSRGTSFAWLSLDGGDNDPGRFARYLAAALVPFRPELAGAFPRLQESVGLELVAARFIDVIGARDDSIVLVLDDYQVITSQPIHALVTDLIVQGPPFLHIVVLTREDPPVPLARLRAHGRLVELRADDLRFDDTEAAGFLAAHPEIELDASHATRLLERTEGWIAGLQLAAITLRNRPDAAGLVDAFAGSQRFVLDYLTAETLDTLEPDLRGFLVAISVLGRFTAELCAALTGRADSSALLARAERLNLFLVPLDLDRRWYRFHHLFAECLRMELDAETQLELHRRASGWFEREGLIGEAIEEALAAGSTDRAVRLVESAAPETHESGELVTLLRWADALPRDLVARNPDLAAWVAASMLLVGRLGDAARICRDAEITDGEGALPAARIDALRAYLASFQGDRDAAARAQAALDELPEGDGFRALALIAAGTAHVAGGQFREAIETLQPVLDSGLADHRAAVAIPALAVLAPALNLVGCRDKTDELCQRVLREWGAGQGRIQGGLAYPAFYLGVARYEANDLVVARRQLEAGWDAAGQFGRGRLFFGPAIGHVALARLATGDRRGAFEVVKFARRDGEAADLPIAGMLDEIEARLRLQSGDVAAATAWADAVAAALDPGWPSLAAQLTVARVRLAQDRLADARVHLIAARRAAAGAGAVADLVTVAVLEAVLAERLGERRGAQLALQEAISCAAPGSYMRRLVDDGQPAQRLLPGVRRVAPAFVDAVLLAIREDTGSRVAPSRARGVSLWRDAGGATVEALTERELEVLRLMAVGLTDGAIAEALVLSLATAKWHAAHIRAKLGAQNRTRALLRARELGLVE